MNYNEFTNNLKRMVSQGLGMGLKASFSVAEKNNGKKEDCITFHMGEAMLHPTISIENLYDICMATGDIYLGIQRFLELAKTGGQIEVDTFLWNWEEVREKLSIRLVNYAWNKERLSKMPHKRFLDLAVTFQVVLYKNGYDTASVEVQKEMMKIWKKDTEDLWTAATANLSKEDFQIRDIEDVIEESAGVRLNEQRDGRPLCYVLTNDAMKNGAVGVFRTDMLMELAERVEKDLFIIPSSVHEVLLVPDDGKNEAESLKDMVRKVNEEVVDRADLLSNGLYYFSRKEGVITMI